MNENEKRILLPLAVGNTLLLISSLCKSAIGRVWRWPIMRDDIDVFISMHLFTW